RARTAERSALARSSGSDARRPAGAHPAYVTGARAARPGCGRAGARAATGRWFERSAKRTGGARLQRKELASPILRGRRELWLALLAMRGDSFEHLRAAESQ